MFEVARANKYDDKTAKKVELDETWVASRKLDGCLHYDTEIVYEDGIKRKIGDVVENQIAGKIKSFDVETGKEEYKKIISFMKNGEDISLDGIIEKEYQWFLIGSKDKQIKVTGNHLVYLPEFKCFRRVDQLKGDEKILID